MNSIKCPKCLCSDVSLVGNTHYICNNPDCGSPGNRTQFRLVTDDFIRFPYNQIFIGRSKQQFHRKPYLVLTPVGESE